MTQQIVQIVGSLLVLSAFVASQRNTVTQSSLTYLGLNLFGSAILAASAIVGGQIGFIVLESCWALVSGLSLVRVLAGESQP
jgi:hypothetical protein